MIDSVLPVGEDTPIVNPVRHAGSPRPGKVAVMVSPRADLDRYRHRMPWLKKDFSRLYLSRLYLSDTTGPEISVVGPMIGAPYAAMILETLVAWGCRQVVFFGWCGAIGRDVRIGDIIIPENAVIDEGTSRHYLGDDIRSVGPAENLTRRLHQSFSTQKIDFHQGSVWTTDAVYRETRGKVRHHQQAGVLGVEMELAALFSVGRYRSVEVAGVLVVSDELSRLTWQPGFKSAAFKTGRTAAIDGVLDCCLGLSR